MPKDNTLKRWLQDKRQRFLAGSRFHVVTSTSQLNHNRSGILNDLQSQLTDSPEMLARLSEHVQRLNEALNNGSSVVDSGSSRARLTSNENEDSGLNAMSSVVLNMDGNVRVGRIEVANQSSHRQEQQSFSPTHDGVQSQEPATTSANPVIADNLGTPVQSTNVSSVNQHPTLTSEQQGQQPSSETTTNNVSSDVSTTIANTRRLSMNNTRGGRRNSEWDNLVELYRNNEIQRLVKWALFFVPFLLLLLIKALFVNFGDVGPILAFFVVYNWANDRIVHQVQSKAWYFAHLVFPISLTALALYWFFTDFSPAPYCYKMLYFDYNGISTSMSDSHSQISPFTIIWFVLVVDFAAKFITLLIKACLTFVPRVLTGETRKPILYQWIEFASQTYRWCLPASPWIMYLSTPPYWIYMQYALVTIYVALKMIFGIGTLISFWNCTKLVIKPLSYGSKPTETEVLKSGNQCSICFGPYQGPVQLQCKHIFCDGCIATWLSKERTCPICRYKISDEDKAFRDGSTSFIFYLF